MNNHYFDHAATTPMHPDVLGTMVELMQGPGGNGSSVHAYGRAAKGRISRARDLVSAAVGCKPGELLFTSGGTESNNMALIGAARAQRKDGKRHIITSSAEHHAVLHTCEWLRDEEGFELTLLPVDEYGCVHPDQVRDALRPDTALVSIMHGNNEVGSLQPIEAIGEAVHAGGALFHVDAVQTLGLMDYRLSQMPVDLMSFSAHKINGPQGVGALYIAAGTPCEPLMYGGSQERKRRAGTENVAGIAGFAAAVDICVNEREKKQPFMDKLRNRWIELLVEGIGENGIAVNGHPDPNQRLPHIVNISFLGVQTESMLMNLDMAGIAAASGSACTSGSLEKSHVLRAMGLPPERLDTAVRFSFGLGNTLEELENAARTVIGIVNRVRTKG
ncbi:cysteine desulfurase family protein [Paenibacillus sp. LHD-117]|uniref:cysteine desulfurase family protein n=1 Tax=Paenibacillus sp. LHD-117 TaxID=3071412 RepID=UPI0027DEFC46|nr:cysteine desulfurase family protein [Paenibacillus sp. LHD-117]MDQ6418576.1 cysteine desulfurase family protein [Paenibacillus sp. LHD-117]